MVALGSVKSGITIRELSETVQTRIGATDAQMAAYLGCDVSTIRKSRMGIEELPVHSKVVIFEYAGILDVNSIVLAILPRKARSKVAFIKKTSALSQNQEEKLRILANELRQANTVLVEDCGAC